MLDIDQKNRLRPMAREKAQWFSAGLSQATNEGRNIGQASIDLQDELEVFANGLDEPDREAFLALYVEELNALTQQKHSEADAIIVESVNNAQATSIVVGIAIFVIVLIMVFNR